jgi:hypothetical protein
MSRAPNRVRRSNVAHVAFKELHKWDNRQPSFLGAVSGPLARQSSEAINSRPTQRHGPVPIGRDASTESLLGVLLAAAYPVALLRQLPRATYPEGTDGDKEE